MRRTVVIAPLAVGLVAAGTAEASAAPSFRALELQFHKQDKALRQRVPVCNLCATPTGRTGDDAGSAGTKTA